MKLNAEGLKDREQWALAGYSLPEFDREKVKKATEENPFGFILGREIFSAPFRLTWYKICLIRA